jgi:hypothetical protein|tara:strand:- start:43 stop:165 length:123 start_codon:yes stop_codon:yes gene_type:complete
MILTNANDAMNPTAPVRVKNNDEPMVRYPKNMAVDILFVT